MIEISLWGEALFDLLLEIAFRFVVDVQLLLQDPYSIFRLVIKIDLRTKKPFAHFDQIGLLGQTKLIHVKTRLGLLQRGVEPFFFES